MTPIVYLAIGAYLIFAFLQFLINETHKACALCLVGGWLFLPFINFSIPALPDLDKSLITCLTIFLFTFFFKNKVFLNLKFSKLDLPITLFCLSTGFASQANSMPMYDIVSTTFGKFLLCGVPYFIGRAIFTDETKRAYLIKIIILGAVIYIPLTLYEIRFSPNLHFWTYGFYQHSFVQQKRSWGWRPMVFFKHGIPLASFFCVTSILACVEQRTAKGLSFEKKLTLPLICISLVLITFLTQSQASILTLIFCLFWIYTNILWINILYLLFSLAAPIFIYSRLSLLHTGQALTDLLEKLNVDITRIKSVAFRYDQENFSIPYMNKFFWFGTHTWGPNSIMSGAMQSQGEFGDWNYVYDSNWYIVYATTGFIGILSNQITLLLPAILLSFYGTQKLSSKDATFASAIAIAVLSRSIDFLLNAFQDPILYVLLGATSSLWLTYLKSNKTTY